MTTINRRITTRAQVEATRNETEGETLDYKGTADPAQWWEMAKDIAALANHLGGVVLVGADAEKREDRLPNLDGISAEHAVKVAKAYDVAASEYCRPSPLAVARIIEWDAGKAMVAVNVDAYPAALVGSRFYAVRKLEADNEAKRQPGNAWQFPLRRDDDTVFVSPEVMPMYMNAAARRTAILLARIAADAPIMLAGRKPRNIGKVRVPSEALFRSYSLEDNALVVHLVTTRPTAPNDVSIPLDDVEAVWLDGGTWVIRVSGYVEVTGMPTGGGQVLFVAHYVPPGGTVIPNPPDQFPA